MGVRIAPESGEFDQVTPVIGDDGGQRPQVENRSRGQVGLINTEKRRHQYQVAARRNRQELGQPLDEPPQDCFKHGPGA